MTSDSDEQRQQPLEALRRAWREHIDDETPFKIEASEKLRPVLRSIVEGEAEWQEFFRAERNFLQNQLGWRIVDELDKLAKRHPNALRKSVTLLQQPDDVDAFFEILNSEGVDFDEFATIRGQGSRATVASAFLLVQEPERYPIYRAMNTGKPLEILLGRPINVGEPKERLDRYYRGLDRLSELLRDEDGFPRHRLDAQGALWISKGYGLGIIDDPPDTEDEEAAEEGASEGAARPAERRASSVSERIRAQDVRAYKIAPGPRGSAWDACLAGGYVCVGWDDVGDLDQFPSRDAFVERFEEIYPYNGHRSASHRKAGEVWTLKELEPGDLVIANRGIAHVLAIGVVNGEGYRYRANRDAYRHTLGVDWDTSYEAGIPRKPYWATATVTPVDRATLDVILGRRLAYERTWLFRLDPARWGDGDVQAEHQEGDVLLLPATLHGAEMRRGDRALIWMSGGESGLYALGELRNDPEAGGDASELRAEVELVEVLAEPLPESLFIEDDVLGGLVAYDDPGEVVVPVAPAEWDVVRSLLEGEDRRPGTIPATKDLPVRPIDIEQIAQKTGLGTSLLRRWVRSLERKGQAILYGPPGTGKTFVAQLLGRHLVGQGDGVLDLVQFHPAYAYEDFIQGLRPVSEDGQLAYHMVPGRFLDFVERARDREGVSMLILDEINRADLARVFGELMYLLEYRKAAIPLAGGGTLSIPQNVHILGTMNTADRSIALVDHALRRRFAFLRLEPKLDVLVRFHAEGPDAALARSLTEVLTDLHAEIDDPNLAIGISYFLLDDLTGGLEDVWRMEIEPYLEELFFDRGDPLGRFSWSEVSNRLGSA